MEQREQLFIETLKTTVEYMDKLIAGIEKFVQQSSDIHLGNILEGLDWTIEAVGTINRYRENAIKEKNINDILNQMLEGIENNDDILIRDILEYEMVPILIDWRKSLSKFLDN